jgi:hypothetical protein
MDYQILRVRKIKGLQELQKAGRHNARTGPVSNANPALQHTNIVEGPLNLIDSFRRRTEGMTVRKNAVFAVEILTAYSPTANERIDAAKFYQHSKAWVAEQFGGKVNIIQSVLHKDEKTPHCHFVVVPIDGKNKLNCFHFLGGKPALRALQDSFQDNVAKRYGLHRGEIGSKARHSSSYEYTMAVEHAQAEVIPKKRSAGEYAKAAFSETARI